MKDTQLTLRFATCCSPNYNKLEALRVEFAADAVVGIVPTGWMHTVKKTTFAKIECKDACTIHLVPYSEVRPSR